MRLAGSVGLEKEMRVLGGIFTALNSSEAAAAAAAIEESWAAEDLRLGVRFREGPCRILSASFVAELVFAVACPSINADSSAPLSSPLAFCKYKLGTE